MNIALLATRCFFCTKAAKPHIKKTTIEYDIQVNIDTETKMNKICFIKITLFFLLSSFCLCVLAFFLGTFRLSSTYHGASAEMKTPKYTTVIIDAGHGGEDGGTSSASGLVEKDVNLSIAKMLCEMLRANGINAVMTREDDRLLYDRNVDFQGRKKKLDHAARLNIMQKSENAIFVSIHMNSYQDPKYSGLQVWYSQNFSDSIALAEKVQSNNKALLQPDNNRKIKAATSAIFLLDKAPCPAVLVECGFLSNPPEAAKFATEEYRQKIAFTLFGSIVDFLHESADKTES